MGLPSHRCVADQSTQESQPKTQNPKTTFTKVVDIVIMWLFCAGVTSASVVCGAFIVNPHSKAKARVDRSDGENTFAVGTFVGMLIFIGLVPYVCVVGALGYTWE